MPTKNAKHLGDAMLNCTFVHDSRRLSTTRPLQAEAGKCRHTQKSWIGKLKRGLVAQNQELVGVNGQGFLVVGHAHDPRQPRGFVLNSFVLEWPRLAPTFLPGGHKNESKESSSGLRL